MTEDHHSGVLAVACAAVLALAGCQKRPETARSKRQIVATYSVLASVVSALGGDAFTVVSAIPNGMDPHEWEPSAKEVESYMKADLIVENGLGLEGGMEKTLDQARKAGVKFFTCSDHITIRTVGPGEGLPTDDPDQAAGAQEYLVGGAAPESLSGPGAGAGRGAPAPR